MVKQHECLPRGYKTFFSCTTELVMKSIFLIMLRYQQNLTFKRESDVHRSKAEVDIDFEG